ncbi:MAG: TRAP transporter TatT component family protein [Xanthomonadales bacterium]|nr:TRAP transporter TatT component family protein [Xanthomonadales bacterium]
MTNKYLVLIPLLLLLGACASLMQSATSGLAENLSSAILNQNDPETVRDGAPAYLLMLDSFIEGSPNDAAMLSAAAELYAAYGVVFVDDAKRADRLTSRALAYGLQSLCASNRNTCTLEDLSFSEYNGVLENTDKKDVTSLYTYSLASIAYIKTHSEDWGAMTRLPRVEAVLKRVQELDAAYNAVQVEHFLAVLNTIRPPALGGDFEAGQAHYERALELSGNKDLSVAVDYARYYARTLYDRELHDRLLQGVIAAEPVQDGYTLFNTLAQEEAQELLDSADEYF